MDVCVNLRERFGRKYRITFDEAYDPRHRPRDKLDPWMMQLPCQRGVIYPHGGDVLAAECDGRRVLAGQLRRLPGVTVLHDGDRELTVLFHVTDFPAVARLLKPRRRRVLTEEQRNRLAAQVSSFQFRQRAVEVQFQAQGSIHGELDDSKVVPTTEIDPGAPDELQ